MERRAVPGELSGRRGVATLVRSFPVAVAFPFIAASLRRSVEVCNNIADNLSKAGGVGSSQPFPAPRGEWSRKGKQAVPNRQPFGVS